MRRAARNLACIAVLTAFAAGAAPDSDQQINHCHDSQANSEWARLAHENHQSDIWQRLFALRVGLCVMVERDELSVDRATHIFEAERTRGIAELKKHGGGDFGA